MLPNRNFRANSPNDTTFQIDFMYVRPYHIPLVNQLAREFFWPGIDRKYSLTVGFDLMSNDIMTPIRVKILE